MTFTAYTGKNEGLLFWYVTVRKNPRKKTAIFL